MEKELKQQIFDTLVDHLSGGKAWSMIDLQEDLYAHFDNQKQSLLAGIEGKKQDLKFKINPKTGEYGWGESPSSVCRSCGQQKKDKGQGYNQALEDIIKLINEK